MKIAIDARMIRSGSMHGIARYVHELIEGLCQKSHSHEYYILTSADSPLHRREWPSFIKLIDLKSSWISFAEQLEIPRVLTHIRADLFHATSFVAPIICPCDMIMTIHDLNHLVLPQYYTLLHQIYYRMFVRNCIEKSKFILTVSNFSKKEIEFNLGIDSSKIFVTYNGVSDFYHTVEDESFLRYVRELYSLPDEFILCVSNNKPHKNVTQLVKAYCYSSIQTPLVLACPVDSHFLRIAEKFGKKHLIYFTRFVDEKHLPAIYSMCNLFVYPSTYEGFGLPPLEALSCGTKVVVARSSSLPEVLGDFAIFADPFDLRDIARALEEGLQNPQLHDAAALQEHFNKFSWSKMVEKTLEVYNLTSGKKLCVSELTAAS